MEQALAEEIAREVGAEIGRPNLSKREAAEKSGMKPTTLRRKLNDPTQYPFNTNELEKLAQAFGRPRDFFLRTPAPPAPEAASS
jgi:transcriptional regulator with XRE-family HTH domain